MGQEPLKTFRQGDNRLVKRVVRTFLSTYDLFVHEQDWLSNVQFVQWLTNQDGAMIFPSRLSLKCELNAMILPFLSDSHSSTARQWAVVVSESQPIRHLWFRAIGRSCLSPEDDLFSVPRSDHVCLFFPTHPSPFSFFSFPACPGWAGLAHYIEPAVKLGQAEF
jgi:hypothetical protein